MKTTVNTYTIFDEAHYSTILYFAVAEDEDQVRQLAEEANIDLDGLTIELERKDVRDQLGYPYSPHIEDALVH